MEPGALEHEYEGVRTRQKNTKVSELIIFILYRLINIAKIFVEL